MRRTRTVVAATAVATLLALTVAPAAGQETPDADFAAEARAGGLLVSLAGDQLVDVGVTDAFIEPDLASAGAVAASVLGSPFGERSATSTGATVTDPTGDRCEVALPAQIGALASGGLACADAEATGSVPEARATAGLADLGVLHLSADELAPLVDLLEELGLVDLLNDVLAQLEAQLIAEVLATNGIYGELREACHSLLSDLGILDPSLLNDLLNAGSDTIGGILDPILGGGGGIGLLSTDGTVTTANLQLAQLVCGTLDTLVDTLTSPTSLVGTVQGLSEVGGVLRITLLETISEVGVDADEVLASAGPDAGAVRVTLALPGLEGMLDGLLTGAVQPLVDTINTTLAPVTGTVTGLTGQLPVLGEVVGGLLSTGDLGALLDGPLLDVGVAPGSASATGDLQDFTTAGASSPAVVRLDGGVFELPVLSELDGLLNSAAGQLDSSLLAVLRDTPLVDLVNASLLPGSVADGEVRGLPGTVATSGTADVSILAVLGAPALQVEVAASSAGVGVEAVDDTDLPRVGGPIPSGEGTLPVTGGGLGLIALLALGGMTALHRRR